MNPGWERYPKRDTDPWDSLSLFLEGYAFERQGRRPDYSHAAIDSIVELKESGERLDSERAAVAIWKRSKEKLGGEKLNEGNNPLCPRGTPYEKKKPNKEEKDERLTKAFSVVEFATELASNGGVGFTLVSYFKDKLERNEVEQAHIKLTEINGIGPKITSFFLRDLAIYYQIIVSKDVRCLLQPIDIWVKRVVNELAGRQLPNNKDIGKWIVDASGDFVNAEAVNQGMWYFAREVAGSSHELKRCLGDSAHAKELLARHKQALHRAARKAEECLAMW